MVRYTTSTATVVELNPVLSSIPPLVADMRLRGHHVTRLLLLNNSCAMSLFRSVRSPYETVLCINPSTLTFDSYSA